ncbi:RDD family protein [Thetidibacter halocola]|uniref:RDD family protein n=1 Tax=Thetidibacter halocola TaxID=2827239 RepID=A0A8J7WBE9_9RHOB|nr:RDD family protein [Thetidibacter halocola]MBS0124432.1 RDD family protein [Thetidibacter halocola]
MYSDFSQGPSHLPDPERQSAFYEGVTIKRGLAWAIDFVVVAAMLVPAVLFTAFIGLFFLPFLFAVIGFVYRVLTIAGGSATWGMRIMAIEFRDAFGRRLTFNQAFLHTLGYTVSLAVFPLQLVSVLCMFMTERGQGLTDMVLGTVALNRRA